MKTIPKRYPKIVVGTFALALVILIMSFIAYDKSTTETNNTVLEITSVSIIDGNYKIDTNIAINNGIKEKLIATLEAETLVDKKTVEEIPYFIKRFLDCISTNQTFDMENPDEAWKEGGWLNGFNN